MLTQEQWARRLQGSCAFTLLSYGIACAVIGHHQPVDTLMLPGVTTGPHFRTNAVFAYAIFGDFVSRLYCAGAGSVKSHVPLMTLTLPALNAAVMVGVAHVASLWAVYAVCTNSLLLLCCMWILDDVRSNTVTSLIATVAVVTLYLAAWIVACGTSSAGTTFALVCYVVACASLVLTFVTLRLMQPRQQYQDIVMCLGTLLLYVFGYALWISTLADRPTMSAWIVFFISLAILATIAALAVHYMPEDESTVPRWTPKNDDDASSDEENTLNKSDPYA